MWQLLRLLLRPLHLWQLLLGPDSASETVAAGRKEKVLEVSYRLIIAIMVRVKSA